MDSRRWIFVSCYFRSLKSDEFYWWTENEKREKNSFARPTLTELCGRIDLGNSNETRLQFPKVRARSHLVRNSRASIGRSIFTALQPPRATQLATSFANADFSFTAADAASASALSLSLSLPNGHTRIARLKSTQRNVTLGLNRKLDSAPSQCTSHSKCASGSFTAPSGFP